MFKVLSFKSYLLPKKNNLCKIYSPALNIVLNKIYRCSFHTLSQVSACVVDKVGKILHKSATSVQLTPFMHCAFFIAMFIDLKINQMTFRIMTEVKYTMNALGNHAF